MKDRKTLSSLLCPLFVQIVPPLLITQLFWWPLATTGLNCAISSDRMTGIDHITNVTDDAPAILKAFRECGQNGRIVFEPITYYVNSVHD
jgi:hypothetical protein